MLARHGSGLKYQSFGVTCYLHLQSRNYPKDGGNEFLRNVCYTVHLHTKEQDQHNHRTTINALHH